MRKSNVPTAISEIKVYGNARMYLRIKFLKKINIITAAKKAVIPQNASLCPVLCMAGTILKEATNTGPMQETNDSTISIVAANLRRLHFFI
jgi:hypothetical protein